MFIACNEAMSILYLQIRHLQPERTKKRQRVKVRLAYDDVEGETFDYGADNSVCSGLHNWESCDE